MEDLESYRIRKSSDGLNYAIYRKRINKKTGEVEWVDGRYYPNPETLARGLLRDVIKGPGVGNLEEQINELNNNVLAAYENLGRQLREVLGE